MNSTPALLNRILITLLGLKLLAVGVLLILLASVPAFLVRGRVEPGERRLQRDKVPRAR